jgi:fumarylacetoacetate (FAA) hydrolase
VPPASAAFGRPSTPTITEVTLMKLATIDNGTRDGALVVVSHDLKRAITANGIAATMQELLEHWVESQPALSALAARLEQGHAADTIDFSSAVQRAPLPRAWQWLDGSAFDSHGELMAKVFGMDPAPRDRPLMYQGVSDRFFGPRDDVPFASENDGIDFEGEFGVIVDEVPMGISAVDAAARIRLIVQINDWSLRTIARSR